MTGGKGQVEESAENYGDDGFDVTDNALRQQQPMAAKAS